MRFRETFESLAARIERLSLWETRMDKSKGEALALGYRAPGQADCRRWPAPAGSQTLMHDSGWSDVLGQQEGFDLPGRKLSQRFDRLRGLLQQICFANRLEIQLCCQ